MLHTEDTFELNTFKSKLELLYFMKPQTSKVSKSSGWYSLPKVHLQILYRCRGELLEKEVEK